MSDQTSATAQELWHAVTRKPHRLVFSVVVWTMMVLLLVSVFAFGPLGVLAIAVLVVVGMVDRVVMEWWVRKDRFDAEQARESSE